MTETEVISIDRHGQRKEYPSIKSAAEEVGVRPCQRLRYRPPLRGTVVD